MLQQIIPAYLYWQYQDDANVKAFFDALNQYQQAYLDTLNGLGLPVYTNDTINGALLDWIAEGLYGISRPTISTTGFTDYEGPFNTVPLDTVDFDGDVSESVGTNYALVNDDIFKRCMTWALYRGDGFQFSTRWLKNRVMRFLYGANGTDLPVEQTYIVSIGYGTGNAVTIRVVTITRTVVAGTIFNDSPFDMFAFDDSETSSSVAQPPAVLATFKALIQAGALSNPFAYSYTVQTT